MSKTYFISDAHLGAGKPNSEKFKEEKLLTFLDYVAENGNQLFIVGDLFDFWFEYNTVIPKGYTKVLCALSRLSDLGKDIYYIAGNHDFWMNDYLKNEFGVKLYFDDLDIRISNKRFYVYHGDGIAKDDKGYRIIKRIFRNKLNILLYRLIHPDLGIPIAKWASTLSRKHRKLNIESVVGDYIGRALEKFKEGFDYTIFGHLHLPKYQKFGQKV